MDLTPRTKEIASITFDLPAPLGPTGDEREGRRRVRSENENGQEIEVKLRIVTSVNEMCCDTY